MKKKVGVETDVLTLARERIAELYENYDHVAFMFSGGKDSTVCLNLGIEVARESYPERLPIRAIFYDEEAIPYETEHYARRVAADPDVDLEWYCLPVKHRNGCSPEEPWWWPWAPEAEGRWVRPLPPEAITELPGFPTNPPERRPTMPEANGLLHSPKRYGTVANVMGIRAQESLNRTRAVLQRIGPNWISPYHSPFHKGNVQNAYPIYDWKTEDVWTAPARLGWDYNEAYDVMEMSGLSAHAQRLAPPYGEEPMRGLDRFRTCFPDVWDRLGDRVAGAKTAARYASTDLYAYGGLPEKPPDMSWPDFVAHQLLRWPHPYRAQVANTVRAWIVNHENKTRQPILPKASHPDSGVSWEFLLRLAIRGDFKGRKQAGALVDAGDGKVRRRYEEALKAHEKGETVAE